MINRATPQYELAFPDVPAEGTASSFHHRCSRESLQPFLSKHISHCFLHQWLGTKTQSSMSGLNIKPPQNSNNWTRLLPIKRLSKKPVLKLGIATQVFKSKLGIIGSFSREARHLKKVTQLTYIAPAVPRMEIFTLSSVGIIWVQKAAHSIQFGPR